MSEPKVPGEYGVRQAQSNQAPDAEVGPLDPTDLIPSDTPLSAYLAWARSVQGSPPVFHLACALALAGYTLCRRGFFLQTPLEPVYPTLWFALLGESGTGKTIAIKMSERFGAAVHKELGLPTFSHLEPQGSMPGILHALQAHYDVTRGTTVALLGQNELALLLSSREPLGELLCKLYDGHTIQHHTVTGQRKKSSGDEGTTTLVTPQLCALFASTEAQLQPHFKESHRSGGLFSRLQWVKPVFRSEHIQSTFGTDEQIVAAQLTYKLAVAEWANWEGRLSELSTESTALRILPSASKCIDNALVDAAKLAFQENDDLHGTRMRLIRRAQVLGMVLATGRGSLVVEDIDAEVAVEVARRLYGHAEAASELGAPAAVQHMQRVLRGVEREGEHGMLKRQLYRFTKLGKKELDIAIEGLLEQELIVVAREASMLRPGAYVAAKTVLGQRALDEGRASERLAQALAEAKKGTGN